MQGGMVAFVLPETIVAPGLREDAMGHDPHNACAYMHPVSEGLRSTDECAAA